MRTALKKLVRHCYYTIHQDEKVSSAVHELALTIKDQQDNAKDEVTQKFFQSLDEAMEQHWRALKANFTLDLGVEKKAEKDVQKALNIARQVLMWQVLPSLSNKDWSSKMGAIQLL